MAWQGELKRTRHNPNISWEKTESWKWQDNYENIAGIFLPPSWVSGDVRLDDLSTACNIWANCKEFHLPKYIIDKVRKLRNVEAGHNSKMEVTNTKKNEVLQNLTQLLQEKDISLHIDTSLSVKELNDLFKVDDLQGVMNKILTILSKMVYYIETGLRVLKTFTALTAVCVLVFLIVYFVYFYTSTEISPTPKRFDVYQQPDCLSEEFTYPFKQHMALLPYILDNSILISRDWLYEEIEETLLGKSEKRGVYLKADIGYGKTSVIRGVICAKKDQSASKIKEHVVAFHVCKFDVPSTRNPVKFIKRLIGFLSTKIAEYGGLITTQTEDTLFDDETCKLDIIACFDQVITFPLKKLQTVTSNKVIIIDAIDECTEETTQSNEIADLLYKRIKDIPQWVRFFISSRPSTTDVLNTIRLKQLYVSADDSKNKDDVHRYLTRILENNHTIIDRIKDLSESNFLFASLLAQHYIQFKNLSKDIPDTIAELFENNFRRMHDKMSDFKLSRSILEIVIASLHPLSKKQIVSILRSSNDIDPSLVAEHFRKIAFCFKQTNKVTLIHISLRNWLLSDENINYYVSAEIGHTVLARYLLKNIGRLKRDTLVDLAIHIDSVKDSSLKRQLKEMINMYGIDNSTLHKLVWKSDSVKALVSVLDSSNIPVDTLNNGGVTSAFVASARGHLKQLQLLIDRGANLSFTVNSSFLIQGRNIIEQIRLIKEQNLFGYGLVHIATQYGHIDVVQYILKQDISHSKKETGLGLSPLKIACEFGHLEIMKIIINKTGDRADEACLFYAAKGGQEVSVEWLIENQVQSSCISPQSAMNAFYSIISFNPFEDIVLLYENRTIEDEILYKYLDLWWVILMKTPLHAAVESGAKRSVELIIQHYPHLLYCSDYFGITAFLRSVLVNETSIFEILIERAPSDRCNIFIVSEFDCPKGAGYAHLDAIYGRSHMTEMIIARDINIDWIASDYHGITPVHYAACVGNILYLNMKPVINHNYDDLRTPNLSSPFHSAAICGAFISFELWIDYFKWTIPNIKDIDGRNLLHYVTLRVFTGETSSDDRNDLEKSFMIYKKLIETSNIAIEATDQYRRNVLHYAFKNGNYKIVEYLLLNQTIFSKMARTKDTDGKTPFDLSLQYNFDSKLQDNNNFLHIIPKVVEQVCPERIQDFLKSWEMCFLVIFEKSTDSELKFSLSKRLKPVLVKRFYLATILFPYIVQATDTKEVTDWLIESIKHNISPWTLFEIARYKPGVFAVCHKPLNKSPFHSMLYYLEFSDAYSILPKFLTTVFGDPLNLTMMSCWDKAGLNAFHYAIMGGNILAAKYLLDRDIYVISPKKEVHEIPWMILLSKPRMSIENATMCSSHFQCVDVLLHQFLKKFTRFFNFRSFCLNNSTVLSLSHIIIANGLLTSFDYLKSRFGPELWKCKSRYGITPDYLFNAINYELREESHNKRIGQNHLSYPKPISEKILLFQIKTHFPLWTSNDPVACVLRSSSLDQRMFCLSKMSYHISKWMVRKPASLRRSLLVKMNMINFIGEVLSSMSELSYFFKNNRIFYSVLTRSHIRVISICLRYQKLFTSLSTTKYIQQRHLFQTFQLQLSALESKEVSTKSFYRLYKMIRVLITKFVDSLKYDHAYYYLRTVEGKGHHWKFSYNLQERVSHMPLTKNCIKHLHRHRYLNIIENFMYYKFLKLHLERVSILNVLQSRLDMMNKMDMHDPKLKPFDDIQEYLKEDSYGFIDDNEHDSQYDKDDIA